MDSLRYANIEGFAKAYDGKIHIEDRNSYWITVRFNESVDMDDFTVAIEERCKQFGLSCEFLDDYDDKGYVNSVTFRIEGVTPPLHRKG